MPLRAIKTIVNKLSNQYYNYGKAVAARAYLLLITSLLFITYFSLPVIRTYTGSIVIPNQLQHHQLHSTTTTNTKAAVSIDNSDVQTVRSLLSTQSWHASAHVQFHNFTTSRQAPKNYYLAQQIQLSYSNNRRIDYKLIQQAKRILESLTTTIINFNGIYSTQPISLATICFKYNGRCLIQSPAFYDFENEEQWRKLTHRESFANVRKDFPTTPFVTYANPQFDSQGNFIDADAIVLTFVLNHTTQYGDSLSIWNRLLKEAKTKHNIVDLQTSYEQTTLQQAVTDDIEDEMLYAGPANAIPQMIEYKFNLFSYDISYKVQLSIVAYSIMFYLVSLEFGKSNLVKSGYTFALAAVFLSIACFTTTLGIFTQFSTSTFQTVPWYLLLLIVNIACLENIILLTNAVLDAGCDMIVVEKISRGLQSVGMPMTITLIAELFILTLGTYMDSMLIRELCTFAKLALVVDYILQMTFVIAILAIDIRRVELADLDDRQVSKRLHELAGIRSKKQQQLPADFCPIQETVNKEDAKSCAECKEFKTHRVFNAFMICLIILTLTVLGPKTYQQHDLSLTKKNDLIHEQLKVKQLSDQFWSIINPQKDITWLQIEPTHLFIYGNDITEVQWHFEHLQHVYQLTSAGFKKYTSAKNHHSLFRLFILSTLQHVFEFVISINFPMLFLCLAMAGVVSWMTPKWRKRWLVPLLIRLFLAVLRWFPSPYLKRMYNHMLHLTKKKPYSGKGESNKEYDADGIHHRGAITMQNIFNQQQYRTNVKRVQVHTLFNQHTTDIQGMDSNAKHSLVSVGQDGRMVLWNTKQAAWMARLDKLQIEAGGLLRATLNPHFYNVRMNNTNRTAASSKITTRQHLLTQQKNKKSSSATKFSDVITLSKSNLSKPRCVKTDQGNKWIAASFDDGVIRVWDIGTGLLVRELDAHPHSRPVEVQQEQAITDVGGNHFSSNSMSTRKAGFSFRSSSQKLSSPLLESKNHSSSSANSSNSHTTQSSINSVRRKKTKVDHILFIQFVGTIPEFCHPSIAEAAARCSDIEISQNFLLSVHKSGTLREWDILTGECIHTMKTQHLKDITQLHVVESKALQRKFGMTWIFTASRDGTIHCWERYLNSGSNATSATSIKNTIVAVDDMEELSQQKVTRWSVLYTVKLDFPITCIATETPVGGMGILVTGCSDGTVKVWNFETGEYVCTLSSGRAVQRKLSGRQTSADASTVLSSRNADQSTIGGPIRKFAKLPIRQTSSQAATSSFSASSEEEVEEFDSSYVSSGDTTSSATSTPSSGALGTTRSQRRFTSAADHRGAVLQVTVTRYCEVENGPGLCRGCDTCFGNGFLIASSGADNKVHAWRLERADSSGHEGSCTLCTKDYHRKQYKSNSGNRSTRRIGRRRFSVSSSGGDDVANKAVAAIPATGVTHDGRKSRSNRRKTAAQQHQTDSCLDDNERNHSPVTTARKRNNETSAINGMTDESNTMELLDIEQLAGDVNIVLKPSFLGKIQQTGGRGVVFCDKILAGVRRTQKESNKQHKKTTGRMGEWEVWFASLQYYDPAISKVDGEINFKNIPVESFILDDDRLSDTQGGSAAIEQDADQHSTHQLKHSLLSLFKPSAQYDVSKDPHQQLRHRRIHACTSGIEETRTEKRFELDEGISFDNEEDGSLLEASENLPFTTVRHIIPLDGSGLACDFGNFIKLVLLDKPSLTEKEYLKHSRNLMEDHKSRQTVIEEALLENSAEEGEQEGDGRTKCQCNHSKDTCSPANKGKNGCCGGINKEENGGKCCGGTKYRKAVMTEREQDEVHEKRMRRQQQQKSLLYKTRRIDGSAPQVTIDEGNNICSGIQSIMECSLRNNCSKADKCASKKRSGYFFQ